MRKPGDDFPNEPAALVLSPEAPYPAVGGGPLRTASLLEYLAPRYRTDLVVFREPAAPDPRAALPAGLFGDVLVLELPLHRQSASARALRNLNRCLRGIPPLNDRFAGFEAPLLAWLAGRRYDLVVIEHFWCAPYAACLRRSAGRLVLDLHNVESVLYARLAAGESWWLRPVLRRFARCCQRWERAWLSEFSLVLTPSEPDAAQVRRLSPQAPVMVYPNALPLTPAPRCDEQDAIVFAGNLAYPPNIAAVRFFRRQVWPWIRARHPGLRWRVVGKNPQAVSPWLGGDDRIELVGPVPDAIAELARAQVVVAPLLAASGTRFKILEAWAAERAVVSTTVGAEGLEARHGEHLLLADRARDFAEAVSALLESPDRRRALGRAGRRWFERHYTWPAAWGKLQAAGL